MRDINIWYTSRLLKRQGIELTTLLLRLFPPPKLFIRVLDMLRLITLAVVNSLLVCIYTLWWNDKKCSFSLIIALGICTYFLYFANLRTITYEILLGSSSSILQFQIALYYSIFLINYIVGSCRSKLEKILYHKVI